jgi:hypothetical protein
MLELVEAKRVKLFLCLTKHYAMKAYGEVDVYIHAALTSPIVGGGGQLHAPAILPLVSTR